MISIQLQAMRQSSEFRQEGDRERGVVVLDGHRHALVRDLSGHSVVLAGAIALAAGAYMPAFRDWLDGLIREAGATE